MSFAELSFRQLVAQVASSDPTPGGGSVAALGGSLAAGLAAMVARFTLSRPKYQPVWPAMERLLGRAESLAQELMTLADRDSAAYQEVARAFALPKGDETEKAARRAAIAQANQRAAELPLTTLATLADLAPLVAAAILEGNPNCLTDAGTAGQFLRAGAMAAAYNVLVNLQGPVDPDFAARAKAAVQERLASIQAALAPGEARLREAGLP